MSTSVLTPVTPERIYQFAFGYAPPLILEAAIRHRVFDVLDQTSMLLAEVAEATGASQRGLAAIMDALVGFAFLSKDAAGRYALTAESSAFLVSTKPEFQGGLIRHSSEQLIPKWLKLNEIVATGKPTEAVNQESSGGEFFQQFVNDIFPMSYHVAQALAAHMDHVHAAVPPRVLDLAAGSGVWGIAQAQSAAQVQVTAVDWPEVIPVTQATVAHYGLSDRFSFVAGDLQQADFGSGHTLATLGHILHSEGEVRSKALLRKTFAALAPGGTIAIAEFLVQDDRTGPLNSLIFAVNMLVNTEEGGTYSFGEISAWLREAGFIEPRTLATHGPSPLILATRPA